jgi:hypothetical protein
MKMDPEKKLLDQSKRDVTKAGRIFLDAVFGDTSDVLRKLGEEGDHACENDEADDAVTVEVQSSSSPSPKPGNRR